MEPGREGRQRKYTTTPPNRNLLHCPPLVSGHARTVYLSLLHPLRPARPPEKLPFFILHLGILWVLGLAAIPFSPAPAAPGDSPGFSGPGGHERSQENCGASASNTQGGGGKGGTQRSSAAVGSRPIEPIAGGRITPKKRGQVAGSNQRCSRRHLLTHG